jgi:hypothetical protein
MATLKRSIYSLAELAGYTESVLHRKDAEDAKDSIFILIAETPIKIKTHALRTK